MALPINPMELSVKAMSCGTEKVQLGIVKVHSPRDVFVGLRKGNHQSAEKSRGGKSAGTTIDAKAPTAAVLKDRFARICTVPQAIDRLATAPA